MRSELLWENKCFVLSVPLVFSPDLALSEKSDNSVGKKHEVFVLLPKMRNRPEGTDALLNCYLEEKKLLICEGNFVSICFQTENQKFSVVLAHLSTGSSLSSIPRFFVNPPLHTDFEADWQLTKNGIERFAKISTWSSPDDFLLNFLIISFLIFATTFRGTSNFRSLGIFLRKLKNLFLFIEGSYFWYKIDEFLPTNFDKCRCGIPN